MKYKNSTQFIKDTSREYSIYVCQNRGIPSIADGLKDAQRKILNVIKPVNEKIKTISLTGMLISSNTYNHGDAAASDAISMMAAPYCNNLPLLSGVGSFGTRIGPTDWGAPRYTYVKKSTYTESLIYTDHDIVPLKENYDGSVLEPVHFLPLIPMVLLNGISGIAVGWSTDILPRSFNSLIDATLAAIDNKPIPDLMPSYDYLDIDVKRLAPNSYEFSGKVTIDNYIVTVTELPPDLSLEKFKTRLNKLEDEDLIQTYTDRSSDTINIEIRFKRGAINGSPSTTTIVDGKKVVTPAKEPWTTDDVIDFLKLRSKNSERIVVLDWNGDTIKQYDDPSQLVKDFVEWRLGFYTKRYQKLISDTTVQLNWNEALKACYDANLPAFLPKATNKAELVEKISKIVSKISIDASQIDRISSLPSYRWAKDSYVAICQTIQELTNTIAEYNRILNSPSELKSVYRKEVIALKKLPKYVR